ncbi:PhoH family protein [Pontivivens insulae]|uniref:PhoH-like protein n=1 Tax=Pontivivens insulae TaxID=1639689 RepID=A0A2R8AE51_9RHOB|nr:PhoH family protein [Pontivivens insulae]RED11784.1 phosphate starvation-inducible protein PhoH [Pontivivens insulae]SPF30541.1 PhoH-like protein [Pontivivens insulae]
MADQAVPTPPAATGTATVLSFPDNMLLIELIGPHGFNLAKVEQLLGVTIHHRGNEFTVEGTDEDDVRRAAEALTALYERLEQGKTVESGDVDAAIRLGRSGSDTQPEPGDQVEMFPGEAEHIEIRTRKKVVEPRTPAQRAYVAQLFEHELVFGLGPAGTGKTYLAVAAAMHYFLNGEVDRIILSRPAVEAGERLGFLPGDMKEKVDPYMQPLYDALNDFLPGKQVAKLMEDKRIEIAPLAFMRGRTLSNSFVILDEAQNATTMQMKMFLTRLGENSRMAITGDMSQIDLPRGVTSGLVEAERVLRGVKGIAFTRFTATDVVRHKLVQRIIEAYDRDPAA